MGISQRGVNSPASPIRQFAPLAAAAKARGVKVLHLNIGEPDFAPPGPFFEGLRQFPTGIVGYEASQGSYSLRNAWSEYLGASVGAVVAPDEILVTSGASEALLFAFSALCNPGEEILTIDPSYANYMGIANQAGVVMRAVVGHEEAGYVPTDTDAVARAITPATRALLLCSPNNPGGGVYPQKLLHEYLAICERRQISLILDESYREFVYDGMAPQTLLNEVKDHPALVIVDSMSKRFSLCGIRIGYAITSNGELLGAMMRMAQSRLAAPSIGQFAAAHMLRHLDVGFVPTLVKASQARRDALCEALRELPGVRFAVPQGAFYMLLRLPINDSRRFVTFLLEEFVLEGETVFCSPAGGFYAAPGRGVDEVRLAFVLGESQLQRAAKIIGAALTAYSARSLQ